MLVLVVFASCIDRFYLDDYQTNNQKIVIDASITDQCEEQVIKVSQSVAPKFSGFKGLTDCVVSVADSVGNLIHFSSDLGEPGIYRATFPEGWLAIGNRYKLKVETAEGKIYNSSYEKLLPSPPLDTLYASIEHLPTDDPSKTRDGVQFYTNFEASDYFGKYFRWLIEETYEYHATFQIGSYVDPLREWKDPGYSTFVCYKTNPVGNILLLSTEGLSRSNYEGFKLHFVDNLTQRLMFNYSINVRQQAISKEAYQYWLSIKKNNQEIAGLYSKQPALVKGNIVNENDPKEEVLGYFSVASETSQRLTLKPVKDLLFNKVEWCMANSMNGPLPRNTLIFFVDFINLEGKPERGFTTRSCVDCRLEGGTVQKPDFFK